MVTSNPVLSSVYAAGLADEKRVKLWLKAQGLTVTEPTKEQDRYQDTDCFVNGVAVSIKAQHSGLKYRNVCFELAQHLTEHQGCTFTRVTLSRKELQVADVADLVGSGSWERSWYDLGHAAVYYILQGTTLHIYKKSEILAHVATHGWLRIRPLTKMRSSYLGGTYRYCNALCGYLDTECMPHLSYQIG
jgi:hypothetical protein